MAPASLSSAPIFTDADTKKHDMSFRRLQSAAETRRTNLDRAARVKNVLHQQREWRAAEEADARWFENLERCPARVQVSYSSVTDR
jgi:hypothetical protein